MRLTGESKIFLGIMLATIVVIGIGVVLVNRPAPEFSRSELIPQDAQTRGKENSGDFLVEFSDFQCPACKSFQPAVDALTEKYSPDLYFAYRHFPLDQHPFAQKAALAAEAAGKQEKFWEMYDYLFDNQESLSDETIDKGIAQLNLNKEQFEKDLKSKELEDKISKDIADGNRFGVDDTPTFYLNGRKLNLINVTDLEKE